MIIRDKRGAEAGRVSAGRDLKSRNAKLSAKWESDIVPLPAMDRRSWQRKVSEILEKEGYTVETVD